MNNPPLVLVVIDGFGYRKDKIGNTIASAKKPNLDFFAQNYPLTLLQASGQAVGLDWGEPGNSEAGHVSLGAGRIVKQYLSIINTDIANGNFGKKVLLEASAYARQNKSRLHLIGLLTSGSVHAYQEHLLALIDFVKKTNLSSVYLHLFGDGKDSGQKEAPRLLQKVLDNIKNYPQFQIATLIGRDFAMERSNDWQKTEMAYNLITKGEGTLTDDFFSAIENYYQQGLTDENLPPTVKNGLPRPLINDHDVLVFLNFREDSMRQIAHAFVDESFDFFPRILPASLFVAAFSQYFDNPNLKAVFSPIKVKNNLAEWLSLQGQKQFHIAESEKYAHVTYFFNGLNNRVFDGETDFFLESPPDLKKKPEMRSQDIAKKTVEEMQRKYYNFILVNFANADALAHSGSIHGVIQGIEAIDLALGMIYQEVIRQGGTLLITSDHGNSEFLIYTTTGNIETKHNVSPAPFYLVGSTFEKRRFHSPQDVNGFLADVAPTVLELMSLPIPPEMTGRSLLSLLE